MPRRPRLTVKKRAPRHKKFDPDAPSATEWQTMTVYTGFKVPEDDDKENVFRKGSTALVLPNDADPNNPPVLHKFWVAKIRDIRSRPGGEVWVKVQWYYAPNEVAAVIKSFDASKCGRYERIFSDEYDIISSYCFSDVVNVKFYNESTIEQEDIHAEEGTDYDIEFYCRYTLEVRARNLAPKHIGTCICKKPYNPDKDVMHFCPRPSCRRAYHRECLIRESWVENSNRRREERLLESSPDSDEPFAIPPLGTSRRRTRNKTREQDVAEPLSLLPPDLLRLAKLPIIRGVGAGGVVGNVRSVVEARRMVYNALASSAPVPKDWTKHVDLNVLPSRQKETESLIPALMCPHCEGPM